MAIFLETDRMIIIIQLASKASSSLLNKQRAKRFFTASFLRGSLVIISSDVNFSDT